MNLQEKIILLAIIVLKTYHCVYNFLKLLPAVAQLCFIYILDLAFFLLVGFSVLLRTILTWIYEIQAKEKFSETMYNSVVDQYNVLKSAIFRDCGAASSNPAISLSQPWRWSLAFSGLFYANLIFFAFYLFVSSKHMHTPRHEFCQFGSLTCMS